jgi:conjugal transfer mating pair stabilization protein TraN
MILRRLVVWFTLACFVTTQTAAVAGPHEEGVASGQAANPVARGSITAPSATAVVPNYTTTPPERLLYRQPNLASQGAARGDELREHTAASDHPGRSRSRCGTRRWSHAVG